MEPDFTNTVSDATQLTNLSKKTIFAYSHEGHVFPVLLIALPCLVL